MDSKKIIKPDNWVFLQVAQADHLPAASGKPVHYERRRLEETILYQLVQEHVETFLAQVENETGSGLPGFIKDVFDVFLECGVLAHGFLHLRCSEYVHEKLVILFLVNDADFAPRVARAVWRKRLLTWWNTSSPGFLSANGRFHFQLGCRVLDVHVR